MGENRNRAKRLMVHYFSSIAKAAKNPLSRECESEINWMVEAIIDAAKEEIREELEKSQPQQLGG